MAQDWGRWEAEQHIIIEDEEGQQQRAGEGVGDGDGDGDGEGEGVQTGSTVWYESIPHLSDHTQLIIIVLTHKQKVA